MKFLLITATLLATTWAQSLTSEYLPPVEEYSGASSNAVETNFLENEPAHSLADDGYRYKTVKRFRLRHRRDVSELSNSYLPPHAASAPAPVYSAPVETAPAPVYSAPAATETYEVEASEPAPAHSFDNDGYRYKSVKRYRLRRRRDVSELSNSYLPPHAASAPAPVYSAPVETAPAPVYSAPAATETYEVEASEPAPAHSFDNDGYRYKSVKRYRLRRRRDVNELSNSYLPPHAASAPVGVYSAAAETAPAPVYSAPATTESYEVDASEPIAAHSFGNDGYRYKSVKRYRLRRRRDVSELSNSYLPPHAASAPAPAYSAPVETAPAPVYSAPAATESYEVEASEPIAAHSFDNDGYRYKSVKRYRLRRRRDVNELSNSYLPPHAASASAQAPAYSAPVETAPAPVYSAPAATETYEVEASEPAPAHSFGNDGYRYKSVKRYRLRRRRDVSELSNSYLPPHAASAPAPVYSAPAATESYEVEASEPVAAHTFGDDGYRYKTVKRYRLRRRY
ncbi:uncharacterized protein LOC135949152 [Calliphora vicina]|uniref:uncharacterized protein LOC135949152 n=1 Tax=Calliphora vicina TaxID=7373 RepID=UPI00325B36FA